MSVDPPDASAALAKRLHAGFTFLSDPDGILLDRLGVRHQAGRSDGADIAWPTTLAVGSDGIVRWIHQAQGDFRGRPHPEEILRAFDAGTKGPAG